MSHDQLIRHAVDAARAGNPALARVHLQKAAEAAPDDPTVWLWLSWLADSPVSMIQCLELVKRHDGYRDIADSGLAFARALARFDCDGFETSAPPEETGSLKTDKELPEDVAESISESTETPEKVEADPETAESQHKAASESEPAFADGSPGEDEVVKPVEDSTENTCDHAVAEADAAPCLETVSGDDEIDAETRETLMADLEAAAARAFAGRDEPSFVEDGEESPADSTARWDGIALLTRTADAVSDELKSDLITEDDEETLSFSDEESEQP